VEAKVNVRNLLVFFNHTVLKIAINNPTILGADATQPQDSDNAKSHLAKI
jgi:hypothetical protein